MWIDIFRSSAQLIFTIMSGVDIFLVPKYSYPINMEHPEFWIRTFRRGLFRSFQKTKIGSIKKCICFNRCLVSCSLVINKSNFGEFDAYFLISWFYMLEWNCSAYQRSVLINISTVNNCKLPIPAIVWLRILCGKQKGNRKRTLHRTESSSRRLLIGKTLC